MAGATGFASAYDDLILSFSLDEIPQMRLDFRCKTSRCRTVVTFAVAALLLGLPAVAHAGMPSINLTDLGRMRLSALSFFLVGFLLSSFGIQRLWNRLRQDFPRLPRLTFKAATGVVFLWGMLFVLVLTMISGARELMTPGAWEKQGATYKLAEADDAAEEPGPDPNETLLLRREQKLQKLHSALLLYSAHHDGRFPSDDETDAVAPDTWMLPDRLGTRYLYVPGRSVNNLSGILAYEPQVYDGGQLVLSTDGRVRLSSADELRQALDSGSQP